MLLLNKNKFEKDRLEFVRQKMSSDQYTERCGRHDGFTKGYVSALEDVFYSHGYLADDENYSVETAKQMRQNFSDFFNKIQKFYKKLK